MKLSPILLATTARAATLEQPLQPSSPPSHLFANPPLSVEAPTDLRIPTSYESAVMARRILALTPLGTLSTVFPSPSTSENRPSGLGGVPIGLMDYIADCEGAGNPTILAISIATSFKNVRAGSNISLSVAWTPPYPPAKRISLLDLVGLGGKKADTVPYSAANLPRFSMLGYLERIEFDEETGGRGGRADQEVVDCFVDAHPDAKYWLPGNRIHASEWVRLVVTDVYWIGGFGDRAYIGWIPIEEWRKVTKGEWEKIRLPGEKKGWKEWRVSDL